MFVFITSPSSSATLYKCNFHRLRVRGNKGYYYRYLSINRHALNYTVQWALQCASSGSTDCDKPDCSDNWPTFDKQHKEPSITTTSCLYNPDPPLTGDLWACLVVASCMPPINTALASVRLFNGGQESAANQR